MITFLVVDHLRLHSKIKVFYIKNSEISFKLIDGGDSAIAGGLHLLSDRPPAVPLMHAAVEKVLSLGLANTLSLIHNFLFTI